MRLGPRPLGQYRGDDHRQDATHLNNIYWELDNCQSKSHSQKNSLMKHRGTIQIFQLQLVSYQW